MDLNYQLCRQQLIRHWAGDKDRIKKTKCVALAVVVCFVVSTTSADVVALYTFDNASDLGANSGTVRLVWNDESGATATNGVFGGAGAFVAGVSSYWQDNFHWSAPDMGDFSVSMHVRGTGAAWDDYLSIGIGDSFIFLEQSDSGSVFVMSVGDPGGQVVHTEGITAVNDGNWHHLGLVSDGTNITLYIDGVAEGTPSAYTRSGTITRLQLASRFDASTRAITVDLDDVGIFDTALSPAEMAYFSRHAIPEPDALLKSVGFSAVEPVDPRFPSEQSAAPPEKWSRWPWVRIRQLEAEQNQLTERISELPQHAPKPLSDHLGYHSLFEDPALDVSVPVHVIEFTVLFPQMLDSIAFAPAFNPAGTEGEAYAFPSRFKIEVLNAKTGEFETVANWMDEDFPDPGSYPVFFADINRIAGRVRITVPRLARESGVSYFALGEIFLFRRAEGGRIGDNMAIWGPSGVEIEVSDSFSMPPQWDTEYLYDGVEGFGFPLSDEIVDAEDLMVTYDETPLQDKVQILLDLGKQQRIGRIDFWPAAAPYLLALPSFGFPQEITVELSSDPDFKVARELDVENACDRMYYGNLPSVMAVAYKARYIRVTMEGLREYKGKRILGLGEISVSEFGTALSTHCKVAAQGIPGEYLDQLPRLVDGCSRRRRILPQGEWIKGLAQRRPLDRRLAVVERELELARATWRRIQLRSGIWGCSVIITGLVGWVMIQRWIRKRGMNQLKSRIARDLHDDVGSNLGGISIASERLKYADVNAEVKEEIYDLSLMAREAWASLREVVWVIDESTIRLPSLIQKLVERAERILSGMDLSVETSEDCPDCVVSLTFKRHLIMFFKEVIHNCARHSQATQVGLALSIVDQHLKVSVRDNGCGFDPSESSEGLGLDSIRKRAKEMSGELELVSRPGEGTMVVLMVPLTSLLNETDHLYKTSN